MKGKGEPAGWITRNGIHIPIFGSYTVRGGIEPKAKGAKWGRKTKRPDTVTRDMKTGQVTGKKYKFDGNVVKGKKSAEEMTGQKLSINEIENNGMETVYSFKDKDGNEVGRFFESHTNKKANKMELYNKNHATDVRPASKGHVEPGKGAVKDVKGKQVSTDDEHYDTKLNSIRDRMRSGEITHEQAKNEAFEYEKSQRDNKKWSDVDRNRMESKVRDIFSEATKKEEAKIDSLSTASKGHVEPGKGAVKDVKGKKFTEESETSSYDKLQSTIDKKVQTKEDALKTLESAHPGDSKDTKQWEAYANMQNIMSKKFDLSKEELKSIGKGQETSTDNWKEKTYTKEELAEMKDGKNLGIHDTRMQRQAVNKAAGLKTDENQNFRTAYQNEQASSTPKISDKTKRVADNARESLMFDKGYAEISPNHWSWAGMSNDKVVAALNETDPKYSYELKTEQTKGLGAARNVPVNHTRLYRTEKGATTESNAGKRYSTSSANYGNSFTAQNVGNMSISGLKSAYADAPAAVKSKIKAEMAKRGYKFTGGKWTKQ